MAREVKRGRYTALYILLAGIAAFIAALNFILGNPFATWLSALSGFDEPLLGALLLMLVVAIVPIVFLVSRGEGKGDGA